MKKVLSIAVAALVLSVGGAFAEPPVTAVAGDTSGVDSRGLEQLSDTDMAAVTGAAWWSGACTGAIHGAGVFVWLMGSLTANRLHQEIGRFAQRLECV